MPAPRKLSWDWVYREERIFLDFEHVAVLLRESVDLLAVNPSGRYVDCTLGGGGHSKYILSKLNEYGKLICFDQDAKAIERGREQFGNDPRVSLVGRNFADLKETLMEFALLPVDGILFDLGVSSPQLDEGSRGFSYMLDAPLDMRMDTDRELTAREVVNTWSEENLSKLIWEYGEEKWSKRIAKFIVQARRRCVLETTGDLVDVIKSAVPAAARRSGSHPAKRTFQAIRIAVNDELTVLEKGLEQSIECLNPGGRLGVITFHSLEDRIVKQKMNSWLGRCTCPPDLPICRCGAAATARVITRKPVLPSEEEVIHNPRSRSAKLRVTEKL